MRARVAASGMRDTGADAMGRCAGVGLAGVDVGVRTGAVGAGAAAGAGGVAAATFFLAQPEPITAIAAKTARANLGVFFMIFQNPPIQN